MWELPCFSEPWGAWPQSWGLIHFNVQPPRLMPCACWWWSCSSCLAACLPASSFFFLPFGCLDVYFPSLGFWQIVFCLPCRSESGFRCAPRAGSAGRRAGAWRVALPRDLHYGAAAAGRRLTRPGCAEPRVSKPAVRCARQPPQRHAALRPGQPSTSPPPPSLILFSQIAIADSCPRHREESKPFCAAFTTSWAKQTPPSQVCCSFTPLTSNPTPPPASACRMLFVSDI